MKPKITTTLSGIGIADEVKKAAETITAARRGSGESCTSRTSESPAAEDFQKDQKAAVDKAAEKAAAKIALHKKIFENLDVLSTKHPFWAGQLKLVVSEMLGREFMQASAILAELEKNTPLESLHFLKQQLVTFRKGKERAYSSPDISVDRQSFPPTPLLLPHGGASPTPLLLPSGGASSVPQLPPHGGSSPVDKGASGLNDRVRTLLGGLLENKPDAKDKKDKPKK